MVDADVIAAGGYCDEVYVEADVGVSVCDFVGDDDVGVTVGTHVGLTVGWVVGIGVGIIVGDAVGLIVGVTDGYAVVGAAVGTGVGS